MSSTSTISKYTDLIVWQKAIELAKKVYQESASFPDEEKFGLTSQIRRASVSIPSNIAEGYGRNTSKSYSQFLRISRGSLMELETQLIIAKELNYVTLDMYKLFQNQITEVSKMLNSLIRKIESKALVPNA